MENKPLFKIPLINMYSILITLIFILMQYINIINWHWIWIISPLWIPLAFAIVIMIVIYLFKFIIYLTDRNKF